MDCEEMLNSGISAAARIMEEGTKYTDTDILFCLWIYPGTYIYIYI